ncbi:hypothetical protein JCM8097_005649 [Rhodosporidiobolus ruineniae]
MSAGLRSRRGYTAPTDDGDDCPATVLDPQEQTAIVEKVEAEALKSAALHKQLVLALQAAVFLLLLLKARPSFLPFLGALVLQLSLAASSARLFLSSSAAPAQIDLFPLVPSLLISLYTLSQAGDAADRSLWGVAVAGVQGMGLMVQWDAARAVKDADELRRLMYSAPEA